MGSDKSNRHHNRKAYRMTLIVFDIETIPCQDETLQADIVRNIKAPANYTDPEKIAAYKATKASEAIAKTSFDGWRGETACIAWEVVKDDPLDDGDSICRRGAFRVGPDDSEARILKAFFRVVGSTRSPTLCGHNIAGFDMPFLTRRAIVLGVPLPNARFWPRDVKPWSKEVFDTMTVLGGKDFYSMDTVSKALGMEGKADGPTGADVAGMWERGEYQEIFDYCLHDVTITRQVVERFQAVGV